PLHEVRAISRKVASFRGGLTNCGRGQKKGRPHNTQRLFHEPLSAQELLHKLPPVSAVITAKLPSPFCTLEMLAAKPGRFRAFSLVPAGIVVTKWQLSSFLCKKRASFRRERHEAEQGIGEFSIGRD